jgi:hypothetical protein
MENIAHNSFMYVDPMAGVATVHSGDTALADVAQDLQLQRREFYSES